MGPSIASVDRASRARWLFARRGLVAATVAFLLASAGLAAAQIPNSATGEISGCYVRGGAVRLIDTQAGDTCRRGELLITWNQEGPAGPPGDEGEPGPPGATSLAALQDTACTRHDGAAGYVDISIGEDNVIAFTCAPGIPHWCDTNTPTVGPHLNVTCDEVGDSLAFVCDFGYVDFNGDHDDGCEVEGFEATEASVRAFAEAYVLGDHEITVSPTCSGEITIACPGGVPLDPGPILHVVGSNLVVTDLGDGQFEIELDFEFSTAAAIPVAGSGLECDVTADTSAGSFEAAQLSGTVTFPPDPTTGVTNRIDTSSIGLGQVENQDVTISGNVLCDAANALKTFFIDTVTSRIEQALSLSICRAPDPAILMECPAAP